MKCIVLLLLFISRTEIRDEFASARRKMVDTQIVARGIYDPGTIHAMREVPRHLFVPQNKIRQAYNDHPLAIGYGQTISQPYIVAYMTEILDLQKDDVVLEIGTGSGYQAAVLSKIVKEVYTVEIIKPLGEQAGTRLKNLGCLNVEVRIDDGFFGYKSKAPFDAIMVTAAAEYIPPPLIEQLKEGGKMIIPVGSPHFTQHLILVEKRNGKTKTRTLLPVRFVPFTRSN